MQGVSITSDIGPLKRVMLHRPGKELLNLIPRRLEDLLFDDIPFLKAAQEEHDAFSETLRSQGVEVVYLEDLMNEVLELHPGLVEPFVSKLGFIQELVDPKTDTVLIHAEIDVALLLEGEGLIPSLNDACKKCLKDYCEGLI